MGDVVTAFGAVRDAEGIEPMANHQRASLLSDLARRGLTRTGDVATSVLRDGMAIDFLERLPHRSPCLDALREWGRGYLVLAWTQVAEEAPPGTPDGAVVTTIRTGRS